MRSLFTFFIMFVFSLGLQAQFIEYTYNFDDLELGNINGQDGWSTVVNSGGSPNEMDAAFEYLGLTSHNGTQAVFYGQSGGNYGRTGSRASEEDFPFDFTQSGTVEVEIDIHTGHWGTLFGFGYDANDNGYLMKAIETVVNIEDNEGGFGIHISNASYPQMYFFMPDGSTFNFTYPFESASGWHTYKFFLDLDANDGEGAISLFIKEIGGSYAPVEEVSDINLGMTPESGSNSDPAMWSKVFLHATGGTSGFENMIIKQPDTGGLLYQYITFAPIEDHLSTDEAFNVEAVSSQGLEVFFEITAGPATVNGNTITLTGEPGIVEITASQPGNDEVAPAVDVVQSFEVIDPLSILPEMEIRNAAEGEVVIMPNLMEMLLSVSTEIEYPNLLSITQVQFNIDGEVVNGFETNNGFFAARWQPSAYGNYTANVTVTSSGGASTSGSVNFEVVEEANTMDFTILDEFVFPDFLTIDTTLVLPSFAGTYSSITAVLEYGCPCEEWDVNAHVKIRGANGEWMELFKYITPYGVACSDEVDITDFASQLQGRVDFDIRFPQSVTSITFHYEAGTPEYQFSWVDNLWQKDYQYGDIANLQPVEPKTLNFGDNIEEAHVRLMCSGHGWGENNSDNAAEFYDATHHIKIDGNIAYDQRLWQTCNPNPTGCQPQNGTWYFDRHGWCPGTIPILWQFDVTDWITVSDLLLEYEFSPEYIDYCHPNHPDCVSGVTCPDCNSTYAANIKVAGALVSYSNSSILTSLEKEEEVFNFSLSPNPSSGLVFISSKTGSFDQKLQVQVLNIIGELQAEMIMEKENISIDLSHLPNGTYLVKINTNNNIETQKLIIN